MQEAIRLHEKGSMLEYTVATLNGADDMVRPRGINSTIRKTGRSQWRKQCSSAGSLWPRIAVSIPSLLQPHITRLAIPKFCPESVPNDSDDYTRHAWGCEPNQEQAVHYLSMAASNSAEVEKLALGAGIKKGGAAKGELVLAMYELANCFRNGWGIKKDPAAAKHYYETAANLGDTDAMNEVAWCYTEGFGTKKDKVRQRQLYYFLPLSSPRCPPSWGVCTSSSPVACRVV